MKQEDKKREPMPSVLKHVKQQNPTFSTEEVIKEALAIEVRYNEVNKERNEKRNAAQNQMMDEENDSLQELIDWVPTIAVVDKDEPPPDRNRSSPKSSVKWIK